MTSGLRLICIDIEKMNCSSEFCNDEPSTDSLLDSGNVTSTVVDHENESDAQETEVVLETCCNGMEGFRDSRKF